MHRSGAAGKAGGVHDPDAADSIYNLFPDTTRCPKPWDTLATCLYRGLFSAAVVRCGATWATPESVVFFTPEVDGPLRLATLLLAVGVRVCVAPSHVPQGFATAGCDVVRVTPELARRRLRADARGDARHAPRAALSPEDAHVLLGYLVSDGCRGTELIGLPVVPTAAGGVVALAGKGAQGALLVCQTSAEHSLLSGVGHTVVHPRINQDEALSLVLMDPEFSASTNLAVFTPPMLRTLIPRLLPKEWLAQEPGQNEGGGVVPKGWEVAKVGPTNAGAWLHELWQ